MWILFQVCPASDRFVSRADGSFPPPILTTGVGWPTLVPAAFAIPTEAPRGASGLHDGIPSRPCVELARHAVQLLARARGHLSTAGLQGHFCRHATVGWAPFGPSQKTCDTTAAGCLVCNTFRRTIGWTTLPGTATADRLRSHDADAAGCLGSHYRTTEIAKRCVSQDAQTRIILPRETCPILIISCCGPLGRNGRAYGSGPTRASTPF